MPISRRTTYTPNTIIDAVVHNQEHDDYVSGINQNTTDITNLSNQAVKLTGDQTIDGTKGFINVPYTLGGDPTTENSLVRRGYIDSLQLGVPANTVSDLPASSTDGDARMVKSINSFVRWDAANNGWKAIDKAYAINQIINRSGIIDASVANHLTIPAGYVEGVVNQKVFRRNTSQLISGLVASRSYWLFVRFNNGNPEYYVVGKPDFVILTDGSFGQFFKALRYEDTNPFIAKGGTWTNTANANASNNGFVSATATASITLTVRAKAVRILAQTLASGTATATTTINGAVLQNINYVTGAAVLPAVVETRTGLAQDADTTYQLAWASGTAYFDTIDVELPDDSVFLAEISTNASGIPNVEYEAPLGTTYTLPGFFVAPSTSYPKNVGFFSEKVVVSINGQPPQSGGVQNNLLSEPVAYDVNGATLQGVQIEQNLINSLVVRTAAGVILRIGATNYTNATLFITVQKIGN